MFQLKWSNDSVFYVYDTEIFESGIAVSQDWSLTYNGGTLDITSWELEFVIRPFAGSDIVATLPNADITKDASGNITFTTDAAFTTGLDPRTYLFELRRIDAGHEKIIRFGNWALYATPLVAPVFSPGGIVPISLGGTGLDHSLDGPSVIVQFTSGGDLDALPADLSSTTLFLRKDLTWDVPGGTGTGTVTDFIFTNANGVSGVVTLSTSTPTLVISLGAITPTSVNGNTITTGSGTLTLSTFTVTAAANATISGTNTGDQNLFSAIAVSGQTTITANSTTTTLTVVGSTNITITTDNTTKTLTIAATGVGTGTVTSFSFTNANGVSGVVTNPTSTPDLTISLGAITPTTVNGNTFTTGSGTLTLSTFTLTVTGTSSITGTNTGDQTITLTSDVTGSGTGSFATTISAHVVTFAKMQTIATSRILGRVTAGTGDIEALTGTQATTILDVFVGDSGSGGAKGLVPATVAGDSAKYLKGSGGWASILFTVGRFIYGNFFDGSADLTQVIASTYGGTGNGFTKISGPTTSEKTFTLPNASAKILTDNAAVLVTEGGTGRQTSTTAYGLIAAGTTATGPQQTLPAGLTTEILVGGGTTALPVWTTATGSGAPVRGTGATLTGASVNGVTLSGSSSTLSVTGAASISGTNTGDQNLFSSVVVSGQTTVTANSTTTAIEFIGSGVTITTNNTTKQITFTGSQNLFSSIVVSGQTTVTASSPTTALELVAGSGVTITTNNTTKQVTINATTGGGGTVTSVAISGTNGLTVSSGSPITTSGTIALTIGNIGGVTPVTINGLTITSSTGTLTILNGKTLTNNNNLTFNGTDGSTVQFSGGGTVAYATDKLSFFSSTTSAELRSVLSDESGTGLAVFNDTPTILTPILTAPVATGGTHTRITDFGLRADTGTSAFDLKINSTEVLGANRTLTITTGDANRVLTFTGDASIRGTNTGDQNLFSSVAVASQTTITANSTTTTLTVAAGSGISITTDNTTKTLTIAATNNGTVTSVAITGTGISVSGSPITTSGTIALTLDTVTLGRGGTGAVLSAPAADKIFFYDVSAGSSDFLTIGAGLAISGTTINATSGGGDFFGPNGSTQNAVVLFANTTGKLGENSTLVIDPTTGVAVLGGSAASFKIGSTTAGILQWRDSTGATISLTAGSNNLTLSGSATLSATTFIGNLTGNASTATTLQTARNIYGNTFNGSADVTGIVALQYGGTGSSLSDPGDDRILFWDDSANQVTWLTAGTGLAITGTTISVTAGGGDFFGPSSSTDNAVVRFNGTTGKIGQNSVTTIDDDGVLSTTAAILTNTFGSGLQALIIKDQAGSSTVAAITNDGTITSNNVNTGTVLATQLRTYFSGGSTTIFQAYDTDDAVYRTFATLTAGATPTFVLQNTNIGTPTAGVATNITGLPVTTGLADIASPRFLGRTTAGTGNVEILTVTQATAMLNVMVGDSGSGGTKGLVPAPASGDATKFLTGAGTYVAGATGTVTSISVTGANGIGVSGSPITTSGTIALSLGNITPTTVTTTGIIQAGTSTNGVIKWWDSANSTAITITAGNNSLTLGGTATLSATTFIGNLTGNASTATALQTARSIYGSSFNGTADLTGPVTVAFGGTGDASFTPYALICGGTTSTGALQSATTGTSSNILRSNGSSALPSWTTIQAQLSNISGYSTNMILGTDGSPDVLWRTIQAILATISGYGNNKVLTTDGSGNIVWASTSAC